MLTKIKVKLSIFTNFKKKKNVFQSILKDLSFSLLKLPKQQLLQKQQLYRKAFNCKFAMNHAFASVFEKKKKKARAYIINVE